MSIPPPTPDYQTSDFIAASVLALSFPIQKLDATNPRRVVFHFTDSPELQQTLEKFWRGDLRVEPRSFCSKQKMLKQQLYAQ